jgi:hypothetical protein
VAFGGKDLEAEYVPFGYFFFFLFFEMKEKYRVGF